MTSSGVFTPLPERAFFVDASIPHKRCTYRHFSVFWGVGFRLFLHRCYKSDFFYVHKSDLGHPSCQKPSQSRCRSPAHPPFVANATSPSGRRESFKGRAKPWLPLRGSWHCAAMTERAFFLYPLAFRCSSAGVMPNSRLYWAEKWLKLLYPSCTATLLTVRLVVRSSRWASSSFCWMT